MRIENTTTGSRRGYVRWVLTCLTLFWMLFIFMMSSAEKDESSSQSGVICEIICEHFVDGYGEMPQEEQIRMREMVSFPVRKCAHLSEYAILGALMTMTAVSWCRNGWSHNRSTALRILPVLGAGFLYAVSDEIHQTLVPGRSGELRDVLIDTFGVLIGICVVRIWFSLRERRR